MKPAAFAQICEAYCAESPFLSAHTLRNYRAVCASLVEHCGTRPISGKTVYAWTQALLDEGFQLSTIAQYRICIGVLCKFAIGKGAMVLQIVEPIRNFPIAAPALPKPDRVIRWEEYQRLLAYELPEEFWWWHWLFMLGWETGLRLCDCALLERNQVDLDAHTIRKVEIKNARFGKPLEIPISRELAAGLAQEMAWPVAARNARYVFPAAADYMHDDGSKALSKHFRRWGLACGLTCPQFHGFRHAFVSRHLAAGVPPVIVRSITGHSLGSLQRYADHVQMDAKRAELQRVANLQTV